MLLLTDGDYLLHRCAHTPALANLKTSTGRQVGGLYGVINSLRATLAMHPCHSVFVVFGRGRSPRRLGLHPDYKFTTSRPKQMAARPEAEQREDAARKEYYLDNKRLCLYTLPKLACRAYEVQYEADDALCWLAAYSDTLRQQVLLLSDDRDYFALVREGVALYRPMADQYIHHKNFAELTGFPTPRHYLLFKAICGGHDNIQGVPQVGEGTVMPLLQQLAEPTVRGLQALLPSIKGRRPKLILEGLQTVQANLELVDMTKERLEPTEVVRLMELLKSPAVLDIGKVQETFQRLEFASFLSDMDTWLPAFQRLR